MRTILLTLSMILCFSVSAEKTYIYKANGGKPLKVSVKKSSAEENNPVSFSVYLDLNSSNFMVINGSTVRYTYIFDKNIVINNFTIDDTASGAEYENLKIISQSCNLDNSKLFYNCEVTISANDYASCMTGLVDCIGIGGAENDITFNGVSL